MLKYYFIAVGLFISNVSMVYSAHKLTQSKNLQTITQEHNFKVVGETTFSILFWDLYNSKLLTTSGKYPIKIENEKLIYEINYLTDISSDDLIERTVEQWQYQGVTTENYQAYLPLLKRIWPDINEGDTLTLFVHQGSSIFYFNQQYIGTIDETEFTQIFLDIWLAENTSEPKLRKELLMENNNAKN
ncbi:chalcone isomerase family protein [Colwelliaceae bacterium BS250]